MMSQFDAQYDTTPQKRSGLAVASLVCSLIFFCPLTTLLGPLLGLIALATMGGDPPKRGKGMAATGIVLGTAFGPTRSVDRFFGQMVLEGPSCADPAIFPVAMPNAIASQVAGQLRLGGPNVTVSEHEISGEIALTVGAAWIREGRARRVLVGGADEFSELIVSYLVSQGRLATTSHPIRPFDQSAQGPGFGEGAVFVLLEAEDACHGDIAVGPCALSGRSSAGPEDEALGLSACIADCRTSGSAAPDLVICGANGDPRIDEVQARALTGSCADDGPKVTTVKGLFGESQSGGITAVAAAAIALDGGPVPGILGIREPLSHAERLDLVRHPCSADGIETAFVAGSSSSGAVVSLTLSRQEPA